MKEKSIADHVQQWESQQEFVGYSEEYSATIIWNGAKYQIPFFVLEDILNEMIEAKRPGADQLGKFLNRWKYGRQWQEQPIEMLKEAIAGEMSGMEAYKLY